MSRKQPENVCYKPAMNSTDSKLHVLLNGSVTANVSLLKHLLNYSQLDDLVKNAP